MSHKFLLRHFKPVLLVIDVQEKLIPGIFKWQLLVDNLVRLISGLTRLNIPIIVTEQNPAGLGVTIGRISELVAAGGIPLQKMTFSSLDSLECAKSIVRPEPDSYYILTGVESHVCVLQTALSLAESEARCGVVVDCVGSRTEMNLTYALKRMEKAGIDLLTTEMVLFEILGSCRHPDFKSILKIIK